MIINILYIILGIATVIIGVFLPFHHPVAIESIIIGMAGGTIIGHHLAELRHGRYNK